jgi:hypothetical protein
MEAKAINKDVQNEEAQSLSGSSHQGGGPNQVRVHLRIQEQSWVKSMPDFCRANCCLLGWLGRYQPVDTYRPMYS